MKYALLIFVVATVSAVPSRLYLAEWEGFKTEHNKVYDNTENEMLRYQVFHSNMEKIAQHNARYEAGLETYELGVNEFADMTEGEFLEFLLLSGPPPLLNDTVEENVGAENLNIPASIDYRQKKAVNAVKNQRACGSCWAFATTGALESVYFLKKKKLYSLSEQNLVDCSGGNGNHGCKGGYMYGGYDYIRDHGIETEKDYPYNAKDNKCKFDKKKSVMRIKGYTRVAARNEKDLVAKIGTVGPVAVGVDASKWQLYRKGIFSTTGPHKLNHGVVAIGYGAEKGAKYYIVRNSWGAGWGENGYIRIARDKNNQVGIADSACYPNV